MFFLKLVPLEKKYISLDMQAFFKGIIIGLVLSAVVSATFWFYTAPAHYKPWTALYEEEEMGPFTSVKLRSLKKDEATCHQTLNKNDILFEIIGDETRGECALSQQVLMTQSLYPYSASVRGTCPMVTALILWEKHVLKPAAEKHFNSEIAHITHYGIFSCRNVRGSSARRSQHAYANAIDIAGFTLKNGQRISLQNDWGQDTPAGHFLSDIRNGACQLFTGVLGPDYNQLHADHFHLDMGRYNICR